MDINDLKPGVVFEFEDQPWKVLKTTHVHMGRGAAVLQTKIKHLLNGNVQERAFRHHDPIKEADIDKKPVLFLYAHRDEYWFCDPGKRSQRFKLSEEEVGEGGRFLKPNTELNAVLYNSEVVSVEIPIKVNLKVTEAPPAVRGDTQGAVMKRVKLETGAEIDVPIFIKEGEIITVNTQTNEYGGREKEVQSSK